MPYNINIPQPRDRYRISQGDMLQNFQETYTTTQINHVVLNDADQGKHKFVQFPNQANSPAVSGTDVDLYSALGQTGPPPRNAESGLVFKRSDSTTINFTDTDVVSGDVGLLDNILGFYWNKLPSGLLVKVFSFPFNVNEDNTSTPFQIVLTLEDFGPNFNNVYWANITPHRDPNIAGNAADADPNVVTYITSFTTSTISFNAFTRNLDSIPRRSPKRVVFLRIVLIGD